jgi:hypothetical protein
MLWVEIYLRRKSSRVWCEGGLNARFLYKVFIYVLFKKSVKISTLLIQYGDVNMKNKDRPPLKNEIRFELYNVGWFMRGAFK